MLDQAIKQNNDLPISELVGGLPSIECIIQPLKGGRPAGALKSVTVGFPHPFATEKEANVRLNMSHVCLDKDVSGYCTSSYYDIPLMDYIYLMSTQ